MKTPSQSIDTSGIDEALDHLCENGWASFNDLLTCGQLSFLKEEADIQYQAGRMKKAGVGTSLDFKIQKDIRGDHVFWLDRSMLGFSFIYSFLEELKSQIIRSCFLALKDFECHLAIYPPNTFYKKHADQFIRQQHRFISFVFYLNAHWKKGDGGELVIYTENGKEVTIEPKGGNLVIFRSELFHEVRLSHSSRYSLTGWMLDKPVGLPL